MRLKDRTDALEKTVSGILNYRDIHVTDGEVEYLMMIVKTPIVMEIKYIERSLDYRAEVKTRKHNLPENVKHRNELIKNGSVYSNLERIFGKSANDKVILNAILTYDGVALDGLFQHVCSAVISDNIASTGAEVQKVFRGK